MAPTTRKTRATAKAKQLLEDNAPEDASSSTTLAQPNVSSMNQDSTQPNSSSAHKRKRLTNSSANGTLKKPRLQTTASAPVLAENNLKDSVREGLILISIGLNPGIMTGKTGKHKAPLTNSPQQKCGVNLKYRPRLRPPQQQVLANPPRLRHNPNPTQTVRNPLPNRKIRPRPHKHNTLRHRRRQLPHTSRLRRRRGSPRSENPPTPASSRHDRG